MHREEAAEHGRAQHEDKHEESAIDVRHELETRPRFDEHEQKVGEPTPLGHLRVASHTWPRPSPRQRSQIAFCDDAKQKRAGEASRVRVTMTNCHAQIQKKDKLFLIPGEGCVAAEEGASVGALTACAARGGETLVETRTSCRSPRATHTCAARGCETLVGTRTSCRSPPCHDVRGSEIVGWLSAASSARAESATEGESTIFSSPPRPFDARVNSCAAFPYRFVCVETFPQSCARARDKSGNGLSHCSRVISAQIRIARGSGAHGWTFCRGEPLVIVFFSGPLEASWVNRFLTAGEREKEGAFGPGRVPCLSEQSSRDTSACGCETHASQGRCSCAS